MYGAAMKEIERFLELPRKIEDLIRRIEELSERVDKLAASKAAPATPAGEEPPERLLYTMDEACNMLNLSRETMRQMVAQGYLPTHKIGRLTRFRRKDLIRLAQVDIASLGWPERPWHGKKSRKTAPNANAGHSEGDPRDSREKA